MESPENSFVSTSCCAFCHEQFPMRCLQGRDAWQSNIRAVLCLDADGEESIELTQPVRLPDIDGDIDITLTSRLPNQTITISRDPQVDQKRRTNRLAFCFHDWCYSVLICKLKGCSTSVIYKLARTLTPDSSIWENIRERRHDLDSETRLQMLASHGSQLLSISRLPAELRAYIWWYIGLTTPCSASILVTSEASRLAHHLRSPSSREIILKRGSHLSAKMISVFGVEYIRELVIDRDLESNPRSFGNIVGLRYIMSLGGICAIQVLSADEESNWIGKVPNGHCVWHGIIRGMSSTFQCSYNDLNCTVISSSEPISRTQVVWDRPDFPSHILDPDAALFDLYRDFATTNAPKQRFFRYLPLYFKDEYIKGFSIYVSGRGIVGLETHFTRTSQLSGYRSGCVLHFPLCPEERIAYVWLRIVNSPSSAFGGPALVIQTTHGRIHTFGSYILPHLVVNNRYKWILLQQEVCITGFYYENVNSGKAIMRLGVTGGSTTARTAPLLPQYHNCNFPSPPIGSPNAGLFISIAALSGLEKVDICQVNKRCTGMLMRYLNGLVLVLGQWHNSCVSHCYCIYNSSGPSITSIYFKMSKLGEHQIVADISFSPSIVEATPNSDYQVFSVGEHIAWWFSERYDRILRWTGNIPHIPKKSAAEQN